MSCSLEIALPQRYALVVGEPFFLFYSGIMKVRTIDTLYIQAVCDIGGSFSHKFTVTPGPEDVGDHVLSLRVYDNFGQLLGSGSVILEVRPPMTSMEEDCSILCVGDSITAGGEWVDEFCRRLTQPPEAGGSPAGLGLQNIRFIGSKVSVPHGAGYVGCGGWTFDHYLDTANDIWACWVEAPGHGKTAADQESWYADENGTLWQLETIDRHVLMFKRSAPPEAPLPSAGVLKWKRGGICQREICYHNGLPGEHNPFCIDGRVDLAAYCQARQVTDLSWCYVELGWNSYADDLELLPDKVTAFLDKLLEASPRCHVVLMGLQPPCVDGCAISYGAHPILNYFTMQNLVFRLDRLYTEIAGDYTRRGYDVQFLQLAGQYDAAHVYPTAEFPAHARTDQREVLPCNALHPTIAGYHQIADVAFRHFNNAHSK